MKLAQRKREEDLAPRRAVEWLKEMFGERAYRVIWEPLMRFKFAEHAEEISAAWIWARMVRLSRSRTSPWREELGYIEGGSQVVLDGLAAISKRGAADPVLKRRRRAHRARGRARERRARRGRDAAAPTR